VKLRKRLVLLSVASLMVTATFAQAHQFGTPGIADDKSHSACWVPNPSAPTIPYALWQYLYGYLNDEINVAAGVTVPWDWTCAAGTDMFLDNRLANPSFYGLQFCKNYDAFANVCLESSVSINDGLIVTDATNNGLSVEAVREYNWCHEGGHSLGLNHTTTSSDCLRTGLNTFKTYNLHHIAHLNIDL
jgi:hypothetical protein